MQGPLSLKKMYTLLGLSAVSIEWQYRNHTEAETDKWGVLAPTIPLLPLHWKYIAVLAPMSGICAPNLGLKIVFWPLLAPPPPKKNGRKLIRGP